MSAIIGDLDGQCKKAIEHFKKDLARIRTGRAHSSLLDGITAEYYGSQVPLIQLGLINVPESRMITIQAFDAGSVEAIEKAIRQSELGLNPSHDGNTIRILIPSLNEERRKELVKKLHKMGEEARIALRNHRRDTNEAIKKKEKNKEVSADDARRGQDEVQKITDKYTKDVDVLVTAKEKEIMEV